MDIIEKYFSQKDIEFIHSVHKEFGQKLFFEYSDKFIDSSSGTQNIEKRYIVGIKCDNTKLDRYFTFMNIAPIKLEEDNYCSVYMGYDVSNNFKKIYFENHDGLVCYEVNDSNHNIDIKHYTKKYTILNEIIKFMPESLRKMVETNTGVIYVCNNDSKNKKTFYFQLEHPVAYNEDFSCWVLSVAFDEDWKLLYHTYYLRLKKIHEDNFVDPIFQNRVSCN